MTTTIRKFVTTTVLAAALVAVAGSVHAQDAQTCQPGLLNQFNGPNQAKYLTSYTALANDVATFTTELNALVGQTPTYDTLWAHATSVAGEAVNGRVVITLPDGTVVVDTARNVMGQPGTNTYANFLAKTINENHNSRLAFFEAQQYPCGVALESKRSSTTGVTESYVAIRLGNHLDSEGTARMSVR